MSLKAYEWKWKFSARLKFFLLKRLFDTNLTINNTHVNFTSPDVINVEYFYYYYSKLYLEKTKLKPSPLTINPNMYDYNILSKLGNFERIFYFITLHPNIDPFIFIFALPNSSIFYTELYPIYSKYTLKLAYKNYNISVADFELNFVLYILYNLDAIETIRNSGIFSVLTFASYDNFLLFFFMALKTPLISTSEVYMKSSADFNIYKQICNRFKKSLNSQLMRKRAACCLLDISKLQFSYANFSNLTDIKCSNLDNYIDINFGIYDPATVFFKTAARSVNNIVSFKNNILSVCSNDIPFYFYCLNTIFVNGTTAILSICTNINILSSTWDSEFFIITASLTTISHNYMPYKICASQINLYFKNDFLIKIINTRGDVEKTIPIGCSQFNTLNYDVYADGADSNIKNIISTIYTPTKILFNNANTFLWAPINYGSLFHYKYTVYPFIIILCDLSRAIGWLFDITKGPSSDFDDITLQTRSGLSSLLTTAKNGFCYKTPRKRDVIWIQTGTVINTCLYNFNANTIYDTSDTSSALNVILNRAGKIKSLYNQYFGDSDLVYSNSIDLPSYIDIINKKCNSLFSSVQYKDNICHIMASVLLDFSEEYQIAGSVLNTELTLYDRAILISNYILVPQESHVTLNTSSNFKNPFTGFCFFGYITFYPLTVPDFKYDCKIQIIPCVAGLNSSNVINSIKYFRAIDYTLYSNIVVERNKHVFVVHFKLFDYLKTLDLTTNSYIIMVNFYDNGVMISNFIYMFINPSVYTSPSFHKNYICR